MKLKIIAGLIAMAFMVLTVQPVLAAQEENQTPIVFLKEERATNPESLVRFMTDYIRSLPQFYICGEISYDKVYKENNKIQYSAEFDFYVKRPSQFQFNVNGDLQNKQVLYDGKSVTVYDANKSVYGVIEAYSTIDATLDKAEKEYGIRLPVLDLARSEFGANILTDVTKSAYVGLSNVGGIPCRHVAFAKEGLNIQLWIEDGPTPFPRKIVLTSKSDPAMPSWTCVITDWSLSPKLPDGWTTFVPKAGMKKIDFLKPDDQAASTSKYGKES